jgi:hypothetical protein
MIKNVVVQESPVVTNGRQQLFSDASEHPLLSSHSRKRFFTAKPRRQQQRASRQQQYKAVPHIVQYIQEQHRRSQWSKANPNVVRVESYSASAPNSRAAGAKTQDDALRDEGGLDYTCGQVHIPSRDALKSRQRRTQRNNEYMRGLGLPTLVQQLASDGLLPANTTAPPALIRCMAHLVYNK